MAALQLTSRDNPLFKTIRLVSAGSPRAAKDLVVAEGVRVLEEVDKSGCYVEAVVFSEKFGSSRREKALMNAWRSKSARLFRTGEELFASVSSVKSPQGALALVHVPERSLFETTPEQNALILCAWGIQDPGNLGTLIRTASAAGVTLICTGKGTVSARNPKAVRSSAGAFFHLPPVEQVQNSLFDDYCRRYSIQVYRTDTRKGVYYTDIDLQSSCAILLGNESGGMIEKEFLKFPAIHIPMVGPVDSLNVAIAGAVIFFEARRQRSRRQNDIPNLNIKRD
jgi:TrmH family RNA methyltransferase